MMHKAFWLELFKLRKRPATWVAYLIFLTLTALQLGTYFYNTRAPGGPYRGFPEAWPTILAGGAQIASLFGAVLAALAVSSEFEWRTSRQNVIDGLSRGNWFLGKLLLLPAIAVALYATQIVLGITLALLHTQPVHTSISHPAYAYLTAGFGVWLGLCIHTAVALLIAICVRSSGLVIGLIVVCQIFDAIAANALQSLHLGRIAAYLPFQVHGGLLSASQYLTDPSSTLTHPWSTGGLLLAGIGWLVVLAAASAWVYAKRDL